MAVPQKRCTTPRAPLTRPRPMPTLRVSITCAPTFSSKLTLLCARHLEIRGCYPLLYTIMDILRSL